MAESFKAFVIEDADGKPRGDFKQLTLADLPDNDVLVEVAYSTVNYKDGLAVSGKGRIARKLPMVAGIDLAGTVVESRSPEWKPGDKVVANGWGMSETQWGGYTRFQRLKVALSRIGESEDDELAYAYYAANPPADAAYDHKTYNRAYMRRAYGRYRAKHIERALAIVFKACGLKPHTRLYAVAARGAWWLVESRAKRLAKQAA